MPFFTVSVTRSQNQSTTFTVEADNKKDLENKLNEIDFGEIDHRFDEAEVDSIDYTVNFVSACKEKTATFADEDLQDLL